MRRYISGDIHSVLMLVGGATALATGSVWPLAIFAALAFALMFMTQRENYRHLGIVGGTANAITLLRLFSIIVASILYHRIGALAYGLILLGVIFADGLDGYYARRSGSESAFGASLDMETDSVLAAFASLILYFNFDPAWWIVAAGFLRYAFALILRFLNLHKTSISRMKGVKLLAVIFFVSLLTPFFFPYEYARPALILGASAVAFSFARELLIRLQTLSK